MPVADRRRSRLPLLTALVIAALVVALVAVSWRSPTDEREMTGSGVLGTRTHTVRAFTGVELNGVGIVTIRHGPRRSVSVRGDDNVVDHVTADVAGGTLRVGLEGRVRTHRELRITVVTPALEVLAVSGSGELFATGVRARRLRVTVSGSGLVDARGAVEQLDVEVDGLCDVRLGRLRAQTVAVRLNGTGRVLVNATRTLDATVAGAGEIVYRGDPERVRRNVMGVGVIEPSA